MRTALVLALVTAGCTTGTAVDLETPADRIGAQSPTSGVAFEFDPPARTFSRENPPQSRDGRPDGYEAQARALLGAANIVGGIWRATSDRDHRRGLQLIALGVQLTKGARPRSETGPHDQTGETLAHLTDVGEIVRERTGHAARQIKADRAADAIDTLEALLDEVDRMNEHESARIHTLIALGRLAKLDRGLAIDAMDTEVSGACSTICSRGAATASAPATVPGGHHERHRIRMQVYQVVLAARNLIAQGQVDRVIRALTRMVEEERVGPPSFKILRPAGGLKQSRFFRTTRLETPGLVALLLYLGHAHGIRGDIDAAIDAYEAILELEGAVWQLDITRERLADLHFDRGNYEESLDHQRAWLRHSDWVGTACTEVCASTAP